MGFRALHETAINWKNPIENVNEIKIWGRQILGDVDNGIKLKFGLV